MQSIVVDFWRKFEWFVTKYHHSTIRDMMVVSSHVLSLILGNVPNGYITVGCLLFLQEQIKVIIHSNKLFGQFLQ
jgi:hypothetical protein